MGGTTFLCYASGDTPEQAFDAAVEQAQYDHGHSGYSGTIAEKDCFVMLGPREGETAAECVERWDDEGFGRKWGPAGCVKTGDRRYAFFGWASC